MTGPTSTEAASTACSTCTQSYSGTSGATPYIGAAAAIVRDFFDDLGMPHDPGNIYAALLAVGNRPYPQTNSEGTGATSLPYPECRTFQTGSVTINATGSEAVVSFHTVGQSWNLQTAIWWPEGTTQHNDINLEIRDPSGVVRGAGTSVSSVFEMDNVLSSLSPYGWWQLRIRGQSVTTGPQTVYYFITKYTPCM
jgi:hypothetical protein